MSSRRGMLVDGYDYVRRFSLSLRRCVSCANCLARILVGKFVFPQGALSNESHARCTHLVALTVLQNHRLAHAKDERLLRLSVDRAISDVHDGGARNSLGVACLTDWIEPGREAGDMPGLIGEYHTMAASASSQSHLKFSTVVMPRKVSPTMLGMCDKHLDVPANPSRHLGYAVLACSALCGGAVVRVASGIRCKSGGCRFWLRWVMLRRGANGFGGAARGVRGVLGP